jgi:shikimate kinase
MNIVLIGFMCSGKSRIGRELATRLGWPLVDTDEMVAKITNSRVNDYIRRKGEAAFRALETEAVQKAVESDQAVIATGGGVVLNPENVRLLQKNGTLVWLKVSPRTVLRRAGDLHSRPLIDVSDPLGSVTRRMNERESLYAVAPISIDTDSMAPPAIVEQILAQLPAVR